MNRTAERASASATGRWRSIQQALPADWALLELRPGEADEVRAVRVTSASVEKRFLTPFREQPAFARRLHLLDRYTATMTRPAEWDEAAGDEVWADLYDLVLTPLLPGLREQGIRGLYFVGHGRWRSLPIQAACRFTDNGDPVYLCDEIPVVSLPSADLLPVLAAPCRPESILTLANPGRGGKSTLVFAEWEAHRLREQLRLPGHELFAGPEATCTRAESWQHAGLLHFSCHGPDTGEPGLVLADGIVTAADISYRLPPPCRGALVVLNGCRTASEEGQDLVQAFLSRGASLVLATAWSVADLCAAEIVTAFVEQVVGHGVAPALALQHARRRVRELTWDDVIDRCEAAAALFQIDQFHLEAGRIQAQALRAALRLGDREGMRRHGRHALAAFARAGADTEAEQVRALLAESHPGTGSARPFDDPLYWAAFQLLGQASAPLMPGHD